jgi:hypothetical protein
MANKIYATTKDGRTVVLTTRTVGQSFGTCGQVRLGECVLAETETVPLHFHAAAIDLARALATTLSIADRPTRTP